MSTAHSGWVMAAILKVSAESPKEPPKKLFRPSDIPIYDSPFTEDENVKEVEEGLVREALLPYVRVVRQQVQTAIQHTDSLKQTVVDSFNEAESRTSWIVKYLREEDNKNQRYGAVVIGGLTGFILGVRRGIIRKLLYTAIGTSAMGAVCFPDETENIAKEVQLSGRHYLNVAYNFLYGVKPGDPQMEVKFPDLSLPKDFSEFVDLSVKLASTVKQAVMPPPSKDEQSATKPESKA